MNAEVQSRAEIIWGYPPDKVKANLELSGYSDDDARRLVDGYMTERTRIIRRKGWKWLILGGLGGIIGGVLFSLAFFGVTS